MTTVKFEGLHDDLKDLHSFLYIKDPSLNIEEEYKSTPGVNKAPDLVSLIVAGLSPLLVPVFKTWIKEYFAYKRDKLRLSQKKGKDYVKVDDIDEIKPS